MSENAKRRKKPLPSLDRVRELLSYDPATGEFQWKPRQAGTLNTNGYRQISIDGRVILAHRLAWLLVHGEWPAQLIDHRDCDRSNNKMVNLREANHRQNGGNKSLQSNNTSGIKGVHFHKKRKKWQVNVSRDNKGLHGGYFDSKEEAASAYQRIALEQFGEFSRAERADGIN
jgi:HNH endonuclease/AP2 domain